MKRLLLTGLVAIPLFSGEFESEMQQYMKEATAEFESYRQSELSEFNEFVKKQWQEFQLFQGLDPYEEPKMTKPPVAKPKPPEKATTPKVQPPKIVLPKPAPEPKPPVVIPKPSTPLYSFEFFGTKVAVPYSKNMLVSLGKPSKESITQALEGLETSGYAQTIDVLKGYQKSLGLNDWGYYRLIHLFASGVTKNENNANMLTWFLLIKGGYDSKVAYNASELMVFGTADTKVYQTAFLNEGSKRYYVLDPKGYKRSIGAVYTFQGSYPKSENALDFTVSNINLGKEINEKKLHFSYEGRKYAITVDYRPQKVAFYAQNPQTEFDLYFKAPVDGVTAKSLLGQLKPLVEGRTELDAVNFLLRFVQSSFAYQRDEKQFQREKPLFPEETIYYPYSDCEDRSILFAYLVRNLLALPVVVLHYPGHLATAVSFNGKVSGDGLKYQGRQYVVTDPTYVGANAGMSMPQFKSKKFTVIGL